MEQSTRVVDQYNNQRNVRQTAVNTSTQSIPLRVSDKANVLNSKSKEVQKPVPQKRQQLSKSTEKLSDKRLVYFDLLIFLHKYLLNYTMRNRVLIFCVFPLKNTDCDDTQFVCLFCGAKVVIQILRHFPF